MPSQVKLAHTVATIFSRIGGHALFGIGCVILVVLSVQGFGNAQRNMGDLQSVSQYAMTGSQFLYSAIGPCIVVLRFINIAWLRAACMAWAFFIAAAIALIPWAWIGPSIPTTLSFAAVGVALSGFTCFLVLYGVKLTTSRGVTSDPD